MKKDKYKNITLVNDIKKANFVTHSGKFHLDDVMSTVFLSNFFKKIKLYRSPSLTKKYSDKLVYDIGQGDFDHHQKNKNGKRKNGIYYSSIGLLWKKFGKDYLKKINAPNIDNAYTIIEEELIQYIDAGDNIQTEYLTNKKLIMPDLIKLCNKNWDDDISENQAFINALKVGDEFWNIFLNHTFSRVKAFDIVTQILQNTKEYYFILDRDMPYKDAVIKNSNKKVKYVIYPSQREGYEIRCILNRSHFYSKLVEASSLQEAKIISNNNDLIYIDNHGKLCCTSSLESAIQLIKYNELKIKNSR